ANPTTQPVAEHRTYIKKLTTQKSPIRQEVLNEHIDERLKVREGKRWGIELSDADIEGAYANMGERMHKTAEQLTQDLEKSGINPATLKARIRASTVWESLVRGRFSASLQLSDKDVDVALQGSQPENAET